MFEFNLTDNMTLYLNIKDLAIDCLGFSNNSESVNLFTFKTVILPIAVNIIQSKLNHPFRNGPVQIG